MKIRVITQSIKIIERRRTKTTSNLKKLVREEKKGEEVTNDPRFIKNLAYKMIQFHKLLNQYKVKIFVRLISLCSISSLKEIRKRAIKTYR